MMREQIFGHVESATSGEFHRRVFDSTHRRIAFRNGVYDFEKGELVDFSPDYLFDRKANVDYNPNLVELEKEVYQKLFVDIVGEGVGEYFIKLLARGLAASTRTRRSSCWSVSETRGWARLRLPCLERLGRT